MKFLLNLIRPNSVTGILSSLNRKVKQLEALADRMHRKHVHYFDKAQMYNCRGYEAFNESKRALNVADKFKNLLS